MHTSTTSTARLDAWTADQLQLASLGQWLGGIQPTQPIQRIVTDSRQATQGDAFLALKGERFDAHAFVQQVAEQGASCVIVQQAIPQVQLPQLIVDDTRLALGRLGAFRRQSCQNLTVLALTGSSGKTTTKEMLGSIFSRLGETLVTRGNLNNDLGVPMMLLELTQQHRYAMIELGASHRGEIDYTARLVQPHVAGVINIGTAHLGEFGGRLGICQAKSEIYAHILADGTAIVPQQDDFYPQLYQIAQSVDHCMRFGEGGDVYATQVQLFAQSSEFELNTPQGSIRIQLPFAGEHNVQNAVAAATFALAVGVGLDDIQQGLAQAKSAKGRLNFIQKQHVTLIDDTYNANPNSMLAAADVLQQQAGIKIMVMGDIGELGDESAAEHVKLGQALAMKQLDHILCVGEFATATQQGVQQPYCQAFETQADVVERLVDLVQQYPSQPIYCLFKGSRYTKMENVLNALMEKV